MGDCVSFRVSAFLSFGAGWWKSSCSGGCINASPAGKRRIATGSEPQVSSLNEINPEDGDLEGAASSSSVVGHSGLNGGGAGVSSPGGGLFGVGGFGGGSNFLMQSSSPFAAITALAVAACLLIMLAFVTIFAVLQVI